MPLRFVTFPASTGSYPGQCEIPTRSSTIENEKPDEKTGEDPAAVADVYRLEVEGKQVILVGTAHVSRESADLVRRVIAEEKPDRVCVELDRKRFEALSQKKRWESLDLKQVIRTRQLSTLMTNIILSSYQKKLGGQLGVMPGTELLEATRIAEEMEIPVELCDRDVGITLKRAWRLTPLMKKLALVSSLFASLFEKTKIDEEKLRELRKQDVLNELLKELGESLPSLKRVLIDERDLYIAQKLLGAPGSKLVAVVGAGHVSGIKRLLADAKVVDIGPLEEIPPVKTGWRYIGWGIPIAILAALVGIAWRKGLAAAGDNLLFWVLANGIPCSIGAMLAFGHPLTIIAAFIAAPFTSLTPLIGAGYVTAFVQAYFLPPMVKEFQDVAEDIGHFRRWWSNRLLRVFLCFILPGLGSVVGTYVGGYEIIRNLIR